MNSSCDDTLSRRLEALLPDLDPREMPSPLVLAYVGDAVFELAVRGYLVSHSKGAVGELHQRAARIVRASAQADALAALEDALTAEEQDVVRRARNAKASVPKSAGLYEYRYSTAFEALLGYLFLSGRMERLCHLLRLVIGERGEDG